MEIAQKIKNTIREVPDFPKKGIDFKDITPIMLDPVLSNEVLLHLYEFYKEKGITKVAGIESRGFLFGYPLAMKLGVPFVLIRKEGKLPYKKVSHNYDLEYGSATIEMHTDAISPRDNVLVHDDLLATGGSASAAAHIIKSRGGNIYGFNFLVGLSFLKGFEKLNNFTKNIVIFAEY